MCNLSDVLENNKEYQVLLKKSSLSPVSGCCPSSDHVLVLSISRHISDHKLLMSFPPQTLVLTHLLFARLSQTQDKTLLYLLL